MIERILIIGIASFYVYRLLWSDGPYDLIAKFRDLIGVEYNEFGIVQSKTVLAKLLQCAVCTGFWVVLVLWFIPIQISMVLAAMGIGVYLNENH